MVTGKIKDAHVVPLRFCKDKDLEMTVTLKGCFDMPSHRASFRWPRSSTFRRPKTDRVLTSRFTGLDSTRERVHGTRLRIYGTVPAVCQVGAAKVEGSPRGAFAFVKVLRKPYEPLFAFRFFLFFVLCF